MSKRKPLPDADFLRHLFSYNKRTGIVLWMNPPPRGSVKRGEEAKSKLSSGYMRVTIAGSAYRLSSIIWKMVTGRDPLPGHDIDHRDTNKTNNRWSNLREATESQNVANQGLTIRNTTGFKGVTRVPCGKWKASVRYKGALIYLGHHETPEQAHAAYVKKALELFGPYARVK